MLDEENLQRSPLFQGISHRQYLDMCHCFQPKVRTCAPDDVILDLNDPAEQDDAVGVVEEGTAALIRMDAAGTVTILEDLRTGGVFGRTLTFAGSSRDTLEVICCTPCRVMFIHSSCLFRRCEKACIHHSLLVQNMLHLVEDKARTLGERVDLLSRRSIRERLLCCFAQMADRAGSRTFQLPFSLATLADYIAADRSAMMREMKRMRNEGLILSSRGRITLLSDDSSGSPAAAAQGNISNHSLRIAD